MKKIEITVNDDMVGAIISLVAESAKELHVTAVEGSPLISTEVKQEMHRAGPIRMRRSHRSVESHILEWIETRTASREEIKEYIASLGYAANSGGSRLAEMIRKGYLEHVGYDRYKKGPVEYKRTTNKVVSHRLPSTRNLSNLVLNWMGDRAVSREETNAYVATEGFSISSGGPTLSNLVKAGRIERDGHGLYRKKSFVTKLREVP